MSRLARLFAVVLLAWMSAVFAAPVDAPVNRAAGTRHKIVLDSSHYAEYRKLAAKVGFNYDREYTYTEFADISRSHKVGIAGHYEFLLLSTGGNGSDPDAAIRASKSPIHWETMYYSNHNLTVIRQVRVASGMDSYVRLLKLSKGRVPDLHLR